MSSLVLFRVEIWSSATCLIPNIIHGKISPFSLVKSSAVFFKQCRKELIQCKKRKQTKHSDWSMIRETHRRRIKSFVFKSSAPPEWCNWWRNFSLIVWYACVPSAQPSQNFFIYIFSLQVITWFFSCNLE